MKNMKIAVVRGVLSMLKQSFVANAGTVAVGLGTAGSAFLCLSLGTAQPANAVSLVDIQDEQFFTIFNDAAAGEPNSISVAGEPYDPPNNPIGNIADFGDVGRIGFINLPPYYLVNPNAWAFAGAGTADILFNTSIASLSLAVRGTTAGDEAGSLTNELPSFPFNVADGPFVEAIGVVSALDTNGNVILGSETPIQNLPLQGTTTADEINFTSLALGENIFGLRFQQDVDDSNAGLFLGGLGVTTQSALESVPEPTSIFSLLAVGAVVTGTYMKRKRSQSSEA